MTVKNKKKLREEIWSILDEDNLIRSSQSCVGKIPNFKEAPLAAIRLTNTLDWQYSQTVFTSPDSALKEVREYALRYGKNLIMATPKIKEGYLLINPKKVRGHEKIASTIKGAFRFGEKITSFPQIDLVVEGSLGVDLIGNRLGKGGGYADREISHLFNEGVINENTTLCTLVHSLQIKEKIPVEDHDEKINLIVTPEMVIRTDSITIKNYLK
ncbi:MAG: 5-formyltetrahydrofolate cyclo-ligase [Methanobacteriaceae archaeon]|nr:5-formyltetrahydrofolate cyclo-ligase [Methanobacteriaceae archaeon]